MDREDPAGSVLDCENMGCIRTLLPDIDCLSILPFLMRQNEASGFRFVGMEFQRNPRPRVHDHDDDDSHRSNRPPRASTQK